MHEGCVVTVEGEIMHEPRQVHYPLTYPKQPLVFEKCALSDLKRGHVIDPEASDSLRVT